MELNKIDQYRKRHLAWAEFVDAWRIIPRGVVILYGWMLFEVLRWYINLKHTMIPGCDVTVLAEKCIMEAPTTQHAALVTAVVTIAAPIFGFYANTGRKWDDKGFRKWNGDTTPPKPNEELTEDQSSTK